MRSQRLPKKMFGLKIGRDLIIKRKPGKLLAELKRQSTAIANDLGMSYESMCYQVTHGLIPETELMCHWAMIEHRIERLRSK